ncbi:MAG: exopolyphosphatase [Salibacteraceae bacterium]
MKVVKFAAIDIGSNAIRLLFTNVMISSPEAVQFKKASLVRVPLRLGEEVFVNHVISESKLRDLEDTMQAFKHLIKVHKVQRYRACATSAMREAANGVDVVKHIRKKTGIKIDIINGKEEAEIIYANGLMQTMDADRPYLYIDVGGGSTEMTFFANGEVLQSRSFNIGTIRLLKKQVTTEEWEFMKKWVKENAADLPNLSVIGSGGNINKMFKLSGKKVGEPVHYRQLREIYTTLKSMTVEERMQNYDLNPDRADVVVPAARIFVNTMKWTDARYVYVPKIGVSDGVIRKLFESYRKKLEKAGEWK